jgi:dCTP deaminase
MSILSDKQIRELCVPPTTIFDNEGWHRECFGRTHAVPLGEIAAGHGHYYDKLRAQYTRPATPEDDAKFVPMISPYNAASVREVSFGGDDPDVRRSFKVLSFGSTSFGYDVSLGEEFQIFTNVHGGVIDPKKLNKDHCLVEGTLRVDEDGAKYVVLPPNSYLLGVTKEYFRMPRDVLAICMGKSTYARAGAIVNVTPIEPGFEGNVVIEVANSTSLPMKIYANEGISQFCFFRGSEACEVSYADRAGKYQGQTGVQLGKV